MKKVLFVLVLLVPLCLAATELEKAESLRQKKKYDEALKILTKYLQENPESVDAHELIQKIALLRGKEPDVIADYKAKYEQNSTALNGHLYGELLESPSERETLFRKIRDDHPKDVWGYFDLSNALLDQDRLQEAAHVAEEGVSQVNKPARMHYVAARIYRRMKEYGKAAEQAGLAFKADPAEYRDLMQSYQWIEVSEMEDPEKKFALAQAYYGKFKDRLLKPEDFDDAITLTELAYIYAQKDPETTHRLVQKAQRAMRDVKQPKEAEERQMYARVKGSLLALQALGEAFKGKKDNAMETLKHAANAGQGPETFYFSALTLRQIGNKEAALQEAIKASTYPPPYLRSAELAAGLWKEIYGSDAGFPEAREKQKKLFKPQRKQLVIAQMVSEDHKDFAMEDAGGEKIMKQDLAGKVILMNFWAVWCPPCREELPHWNAFYAKHKNDPGLALVAVGDEPWETMTNYIKNQNYDFAVYRNEEYWEQFDVSGIPTLLVIDPKGKIRFRNVGFEEGMEYEETLEWQIEAARL